MNVNFTGKLIIDKSLRALKKSNPDEIIALTERVLYSPDIQRIFPQDITLLGRTTKIGDVVEIRCGNLSFEVHSTNGVFNSTSVPQQILLAICEKYNKHPKRTDFPNILAKIQEIIKENGAN